MTVVFIDSDVLLDVALDRKPFSEASNQVIRLVERRKCRATTSAIVISNIFYVLRKLVSPEKAKEFILESLELIRVTPTTHQSVLDALEAGWADLEDAFQNFTAISASCDCIVTRNKADYKKSALEVYSPLEFAALFVG